MKTFHPESDLLGSRRDGDDYVYRVRRGDDEIDVRVPVERFSALPDGPGSAAQRRAILAQAVRDA